MANFDAFIKTLLKHEGGFVDHPNDPGGATNKGITMNTFKQHAQSLLGVEPTLDNLKALTDEQAAKIYKKMYWDRIKGDDMQLQELAEIVFDFYVNAGANASKLLQRVICDMGQQIAVDGGIGPATLRALNQLDQKEVYRRYKKGRLEYYQNLCEKNPKLKVFLKGWTNRVNSFPDL
ncbi:MAG: N-acetylmuramidase [Gemmatimonadetes bacterium]|nr:MAG: N-acetylmuramidase [Gemmatimonadota bacterium]